MNKDAQLIKLNVSGKNCWFLDIDQAEMNGNVYHALIKCDENGVPDENSHMIVEKEREMDGEIELVPLSDEEFDAAMGMMIKRQGIDAINNITDENGCFEMDDEDGNSTKFELIDTMEYNGVIYHAVIPADSNNDEFVVLKEIPDEEGIILGTVDDEEEYEEVGNLFLERFADEDESYDEDE